MKRRYELKERARRQAETRSGSSRRRSSCIRRSGRHARPSRPSPSAPASNGTRSTPTSPTSGRSSAPAPRTGAAGTHDRTSSAGSSSTFPSSDSAASSPTSTPGTRRSPPISRSSCAIRRWSRHRRRVMAETAQATNELADELARGWPRRKTCAPPSATRSSSRPGAHSSAAGPVTQAGRRRDAAPRRGRLARPRRYESGSGGRGGSGSGRGSGRGTGGTGSGSVPLTRGRPCAPPARGRSRGPRPASPAARRSRTAPRRCRRRRRARP